MKTYKDGLQEAIMYLDSLANMYLARRLDTDDFTDKNRYAEAETALQTVTAKLLILESKA